MKKSLKITITVLAVIAVIGITLYIISSVNKKDFDSSESTNPSICVAESKIAVKSSPCAIGLPKGSIPEGADIKVLISNNEWSKVVAFTDKKVKTGYVKTEKLGKLNKDTVFTSILEFEENNIALNINETLELSPITKPFYSNEKIEYTSSDSNIVSAENNVITGIGEGSAVITAKSANCTAEINVTVAASPQDFQFAAHTLYIDIGTSENLLKQINYTADDNIKNKIKIKFYADDNETVKIDGNKITALSEGETTLTAAAGTKKAKCQIIVRSISGNSKSELKMPNAYGNQIDYHPSVQFFENKWNGYTYWCAFTPYERCNDFWENPHILASNDLVNWETPAGYSNPLEPVPSDYEYGISYNSDTELVYNSDKNQLECWWRYYDYRNETVSLYRKITKDGVHWSEKQQTMASTPLSKHDFLSPALVYENGTYKMWAIDLKQGYVIHYYESADGLKWTEPKIINVEYENPTVRHWHLDVIHTPKGYEMLISAFPKDSSDHLHMSLYYAFSKDNENYSKARLILRPRTGTNKWDNQGLYRSSLLYANNKYYCFYSGINNKKGPVGIGMVSGDNPFHMN